MKTFIILRNFQILLTFTLNFGVFHYLSNFQGYFNALVRIENQLSDRGAFKRRGKSQRMFTPLHERKQVRGGGVQDDHIHFYKKGKANEAA